MRVSRQNSFSARICYLRWPTTVISKPNAHSKLQIVHCKALRANSNRSQQIQIACSELQITHSKLQIAHSKLQFQMDHSKFKSLTANSRVCLFVEGIFSSVEGTLSRVPILQRGNLISNFLDVYNAYNVRRISIQLRIDYPWGLSIMPKIPEILVGIQMERSVSVSSDRNIRDHLWRWSTYFGWNIPIEIRRSI